MKKLKKISLGSASEFLTEPEMKKVTGGYGTGCGRYKIVCTLENHPLIIYSDNCHEVADFWCDDSYVCYPDC